MAEMFRIDTESGEWLRVPPRPIEHPGTWRAVLHDRHGRATEIATGTYEHCLAVSGRYGIGRMTSRSFVGWSADYGTVTDESFAVDDESTRKRKPWLSIERTDLDTTDECMGGSDVFGDR